MHLLHRRSALVAISTFVGASLLTLSVGTAEAGYPQRDCVSGKLKGAAKYCQSVLKAMGKFQKTGDGTKLANSLSKAGDKLDKAYDKADDKALKGDVDCTMGPAPLATTQGMLDTETTAIETLILDGVPAGNDDEKKCRSSLLGAAAKLCGGILKGESLYLKKYDTDLLGTKRDKIQDKADTKFDKVFDKATIGKPGCPTVTNQDIRDAVALATDGTMDDTHGVVDVTDASFTSYVPTPNPFVPLMYESEELFPKCSRDSSLESTYLGFYRKGSVNKLLMYYQGGGACWNRDSCNLAQLFKQTAGVGDDPTPGSVGLADWDNPLNPWKDWHIVYVPYCTGDIHVGNTTKLYDNPIGPPAHDRVNHRGRVNAKAMEKLARDLFVNPEHVYVTGSSAGGLGAVVNSVFLIEDAYPASKFDVLSDAGDGVPTQDWIDNGLPNWNFAATAAESPILANVDQGSVLVFQEGLENLANTYPEHDFATFIGRYDQVFTQFYHVMLNPNPNPSDLLFTAGFLANVWPQYWEDTCGYDSGRAAQHIATLANTTNGNYQVYVGAGSAHTMFGLDRVYTDTTGTGITIVDWINQQMNDDVAWTSRICADGSCDPIATCQGGTNAGGDCSANGDADCPGGACAEDPVAIVDTCQGGTNNGLACVDDSGCPDGLCADGSPFLPGGTVNCPYPY